MTGDAREKAEKQAAADRRTEQIRQLYDETQVLNAQKGGLKRLKWLDKSANHSHGLKNIHRPVRQTSKTRSGSRKRPFVQEGDYQKWTNSIARQTVLWDEEKCLMEFEKHIFPKTEGHIFAIFLGGNNKHLS